MDAAGIGNLSALIERTVDRLGYELVDLQLSNGARSLRVFIDHAPRPSAAGGRNSIAVEDCERVSRQLQHALAVDGFDYDRLEVSSPGLDRVLRKRGDFERFAGEKVEVKLRVPIDGRRKAQGVLRLVDDDGIGVVLSSDVELRVRWADLDKVRLVPAL